MRFAPSRRRLLASSLALPLLPLASAGRARAQSGAPLKIGFVYVGPVSDHGWSYQHDQGRKAIEAKFGDQVQTSFVEQVAEGPDAERVIDQLAADGHGLIFTTSFGFMNPTLKVAKAWPEVKFEHATGYKRDSNVATYSGRFYEGRTVCGAIAGHVTKSNIIGYIGSFPIPEVLSGINAFTLALHKIKPEAQIRTIWVNSWYDPAKEAEAARALLDQGADILCQHTDSPAPMQVAEERGAFAFGQSSDMTRFGPKAHLTSIVDDWGPYYLRRVEAVLGGSWTATDTWEGLAQGMVVMSAFNAGMPEPARAAGQAALDAVKAGSLHPFTGPIRSREGEEKIAAGATATDAEILGMSWLVPGVQGDLPQ